MTHQEIDQMEAGFEMDAMIERRVFGHQTFRCIDGAYRASTGVSGRKRNVAEYSTDIGAAWLVLEKLKSVSLARRLNGQWTCWCWQKTHYIGVADAAPLAICRAALKAVTPDEPELADHKATQEQSDYVYVCCPNADCDTPGGIGAPFAPCPHCGAPLQPDQVEPAGLEAGESEG